MLQILPVDTVAQDFGLASQFISKQVSLIFQQSSIAFGSKSKEQFSILVCGVKICRFGVRVTSVKKSKLFLTTPFWVLILILHR